MLNAMFYFPDQFIGIYLWKKNKTVQAVEGEDVTVQSLTKKGWMYTIVSIVILTAAYGLFMKYLGGNLVWTDSATNVLSIAAQILMLKRFTEQWLLWISVNILSIFLWITALVTQAGNDFLLLVMWSAFLVNSIYGYINWGKLYNKQLKEAA
ncbi:nicotinamide mononucleotide transporter PnuC [Neobacillus niacini]|nr:nicotinamide mononucleotide transporter PnuC [Neobacillus niacini]